MNAEQKQQAKQLIADWTNVSKTSTPAVWFLNGDCMAGFLQELIDAPTPEPFGYFKAEPFGWTDCAETDDGAIALFDVPPAPTPAEAPADVALDAERLDWLLRNLPGDALRYCVGVLSDTSDGKEFRKAIDAAMSEKGGA